jgi:hypothetical protein
VSRHPDQFGKGKGDVGIILTPKGFEVYINSETSYKPLLDLVSTGSHKLSKFLGVTIIAGLDLLSGYLTGVEGEVIDVTDDSGRWIGRFQDTNLDHATINGSEIAIISLPSGFLYAHPLVNVISSNITSIVSITEKLMIKHLSLFKNSINISHIIFTCQ